MTLPRLEIAKGGYSKMATRANEKERIHFQDRFLGN